MSLFQAIILAAVQGLGEFLPISSSAHLILIPWLLGWPDPGQAFDVALHAGTLLAVVVYFFKDWVELTAAGLGLHYPRTAAAPVIAQNRRIFWYLVAATIPGGLVGFLFEKRIEENLRNPRYIAIAMIAIALLMWIAERVGRLAREIEQLHFGDAMAIGPAQAPALFHG